jgi:hypothetical protein
VILAAHGLELSLPAGWSAHAVRGPERIVTVHAGDFPVALRDSSTFGDRSTELMPSPAVFIALVEYLPGHGLVPGAGLFAPRRIPRSLDPLGFAANGVAHPRPGQVGTQHFFTTAGRPFCLYVVLSGGRLERGHRLRAVDHVLSTLRIAPRV